MGIRILIIIVLIQIILIGNLISQDPLFFGYCDNAEAKGVISDLNDYIEDSLYVTCSEQEDGIVFTFINTTDSKSYLFSSYLSELLQSSTYLHRVNSKTRSYYVSFLPLRPYLTTIRNDKLIIGNKRIISKGQVLYDFIEIGPNTYHEFKVNYENLFQNIENSNSVVCDFDTKSKGKFDTIEFDELSLNELKDKYQLSFQFAVYSHIDVLCAESAYYLKENEFESQSGSFEILDVLLDPQNYSHRIFAE